MLLRQGTKTALVGVAIGIAAALALTEFMRSLLFGVSAQDPATFAGVAILLILVALLASYIPARHAMLVRSDRGAAVRIVVLLSFAPSSSYRRNLL
jgi:ABC-type lipoprotein release transport system permease subunit